MTDEQLQKVRDANVGKKLMLLTAQSGEEVVIRRPTRPEWKRFQTKGQDDSQRADAAEQLLRSCVVHPDTPGFDAMLDDAPGLTQTFLKGLTEFAGARAEVEKKVL